MGWSQLPNWIDRSDPDFAYVSHKPQLIHVHDWM